MPISPLHKHLIQRSFGTIAVQADFVGQMFYARLFALDPNVRPMFKHDMSEQVQKLMRMLATFVSYLDEGDKLTPIIEELAARHVDYGVQPQHYATVREALLWAFGEALGAKATPEVMRAWAALYNYVAEVAIRHAYGPGYDQPDSDR